MFCCVGGFFLYDAGRCAYQTYGYEHHRDVLHSEETNGPFMKCGAKISVEIMNNRTNKIKTKSNQKIECRKQQRLHV
jgi:hypothetical protein